MSDEADVDQMTDYSNYSWSFVLLPKQTILYSIAANDDCIAAAAASLV